jgi:aminopeptidase N
MYAISDSAARYNTYLGEDADWVRFETIVSTSADQIAISPGYLQREWQENGRRYFHYKMDAPILNFYSFLSARYRVYREKWNGIDIEIYYHQPHDFNLDKMVKSIKHSIDYFSKNFSPYQHRQMRIIEFPRYANFAQSFPNTVPYSESIGFIANLKDPDDIDYVYYVTAHEVAHQWWAHQVIGADMQGATVMSESMSQYSALMVMEKEYGKDKMKKFLKYELDRYLGGRANEFEKELPLIYNENQPYIHYRKGSLVMYALRDYIGEEKLNAALEKYVQDVAYQEAPFTTSLEFLDYIRQAVPDSLAYIVEDWFETITLYDNCAVSTTYSPTADGRYEVQLELASRKLRADSLGVESEIPLADWIEIGILGAEGKELYLQKHKIERNEVKLEIVVDEEPVEAGIDPYIKLIDRNPDDNLKRAARVE